MNNRYISIKYLICPLLAFIFFSTFLVSYSHAVAIMSIDFGSEWIKIGVVALGMPMEIALNHESKRKTPAAISFRDEVRSFGQDAIATGMRFPKWNYMFLLDLLGKKVDNSYVELYKERFPYYKIEADPDRGTVVFRHDENTVHSVEELVAQILTHARDIAVAHTNQKVKDVVITVPAYFHQAERRALLDAADLAGLKVLSLISDNAAVALNYGMFRRQEINGTAQNILFYDMGSSSSMATVAAYQTIKTKEKGYSETNPQVSILGVGFDRTLGGFDKQIRLRDFLAEEFNKVKKDKTSGDVRDSPKAMAKLLKAADKLRTVLSANNEHLVQVESVLNDEDFRLKVTREKFEEICDDLFQKVSQPIDDALIASGLDMSFIHQVVIVGGGTRVPKVKKILTEHLGRDLGMNINADEAAALGAVYRAADLGQGFKVKKFHVKESVLYPIQVEFERTFEKDDGKLDSKVVKRSLFPLSNAFPQKKIMTFNKHRSDFGFSVNYDLSSLNKHHLNFFGSPKLFYVMVEGVTDAFEKYPESEYSAKGIKAHFQISDSGLLNITSIEALFEKNATEAEMDKEGAGKKGETGDDSIFSKFSKFVSGSDDSEDNGTQEEKEAKGSEGEAPEAPSKDEATTKPENKTDSEKPKDKGSKPGKPKVISVQVQLNYTINYLDVKQLPQESRDASLEKIKLIVEKENIRLEMERIRNTLESTLLDIKDKLEDENYVSVSTEEDRNDILALVSKHQEWLEYEATDVASDFETRLNEVEILMAPIHSRVKEIIERPEALKQLWDMINKSQQLHEGLKEASQNDSYLAGIVIDSLADKINSTIKWLMKKEKEQEEAPLTQDPLLTVASIGRKMIDLNEESQRVIRAIKIAKATREREEAAALKKKLEEAKAKAAKEAKLKETQNETTKAEAETEVEVDAEASEETPQESVPTEEPTTGTEEPKIVHEEI